MSAIQYINSPPFHAFSLLLSPVVCAESTNRLVGHVESTEAAEAQILPNRYVINSFSTNAYKRRQLIFVFVMPCAPPAPFSHYDEMTVRMHSSHAIVPEEGAAQEKTFCRRHHQSVPHRLWDSNDVLVRDLVRPVCQTTNKVCFFAWFPCTFSRSEGEKRKSGTA